MKSIRSYNMFVCVTLKHKTELVPSVCKKSHRMSWGFGRSGMMLDSKQTDAMAMDMKSRLRV